MPLKGKLKLLERKQSLPDRLRERGFILSSEPPGEELETFQTDGAGSERWGDESLIDGEDTPPVQLGARVVPKNGKKTSEEIPEERTELEFELSQKVVNLEALRSTVSNGHLDGGLRAIAWKLLLDYLPANRDAWKEELSVNRLRYAQLKKELLLNPFRQSEISRKEDEMLSFNKQDSKIDVDGPLSRREISNGDHPLNLGNSSIWCQYFKDAEIAEQIDRDLQRTHPDIKFFSGDTSLSKKNREAMRNILLLFAKLNPAIGYVQGMNEVLAPLYYVFSKDPDEQNASNAEADSFGCFVRLLGDSVDHFCQQLDNSPVGIHSTLSHLSELLKTNDEELWRHLEISKVKPQFYAFRWITLLLTQEFEFQSIMRVWDSLLSNPLGVQEMLLRVCCAMLLCARRELLNGDFAANLKLLLHYPRTDLDSLLDAAQKLTSSSCSHSPCRLQATDGSENHSEKN